MDKRPKIEVGDTVRFRTDGDYKDIIPWHYPEDYDKSHTVVNCCDEYAEIRVNDRHERFEVPTMFLDICNTVEDISEGGEVLFTDGKTYTVLRSNELSEFLVTPEVFVNDEYFCWFSKKNGIHMRATCFYKALRIVKKASTKPLLADAKKGDLCKRSDGKYVQISEVVGNSVFKYPNPEANSELCQFICDETGDTKRWGKIDEADIIATEPLAAKGTAEWAWQMMLLGKDIIHEKLPTFRRFDTFSATEIRVSDAEGEVVEIIPYEKFLSDGDCSGWRIYEPVKEPIAECVKCSHKEKCPHYNDKIDHCVDYVPREPVNQFAVGDWVLYRLDSQDYYGEISKTISHVCYLSVTTEELENDQARSIHYSNIIRKLQASEVVLDFGAFSGTIKPVFSGNFQSQKRFIVKTKCVNNVILWFQDIESEALQTTVRSLLASIEKEQ